MAELGDGGGTGYPGALDTDSTVETTADVTDHNVMNDIAAAVIAVETELGLNPAGTMTDVVSRLNVLTDSDGKLQNSGVDAGTIDRDRMNQHAFKAVLSGDQTIGTGAYTTITFDTASWDESSDFDTTNNYFVAPFTGYYLFTATIAFTTALGDADWMIARLMLNSANSRGYFRSKTAGGVVEPIINMYSIIAMTAAETMEVEIYHNRGGDEDIDATYCNFTGAQLG